MLCTLCVCPVTCIAATTHLHVLYHSQLRQDYVASMAAPDHTIILAELCMKLSFMHCYCILVVLLMFPFVAEALPFAVNGIAKPDA